MPLTGAGLIDAAQALLDSFTTGLEAQGIAVPSIRYVAPGSNIAFDGAQLVVGLGQLDQGPAGGSNMPLPPHLTQHRVEFTVLLLRAVATITDRGMPSADEIAADGATMLTDAAALFAVGESLKNNYALVPPTAAIVIGPLIPLGPEGGLAGSRLTIAWTVT